MRIAKIEDDQFILPLGDDIEYVSYDAATLTEDFANLLSQHGWDDESIIEAFENQIAYLKSKEGE